MERKYLIVIIGVLLVVVLTGGLYYSLIYTPSPTKKTTIVLGTLRGIITNLDPGQEYSGETMTINYNVFDPIYRVETGVFPEFKYIPCLAVSEPVVSEDGLEWTIPLRKGVKFHDGTSFNASAMKFSLDRVKELNSYIAYMIDVIDKAEVVDDYTIKLILKCPYSPLKGILALPVCSPVSPTAVQKMGLEAFQDKPVGTGPFKYVEWVKGDRVVLERFEDYWNKNAMAKCDRFIYKIYMDSSTLKLALEKGEVDLAWKGIMTTDVSSLIENPDINYVFTELEYIRWVTLNMNLTNSPLQDVRVRKAIAACIDQDEISEKIYHGCKPPVKDSVFLPGLMEKPSWRPYCDKVNITKAKQLLEEAGYPNGIDITLWYTPFFGKEEPDLAVLLQEQLAKAEIRVQFEALEAGAFFARFRTGEFEATLADMAPDWMDPGSTSYFIANSQGSYAKRVYLNDTLLDEWDTKGTEVTDLAEREKIYGQIQDRLAEYMCYIPLVKDRVYWWYTKDITGVESYYMNAAPYWLITKKQ